MSQPKPTQVPRDLPSRPANFKLPRASSRSETWKRRAWKGAIVLALIGSIRGCATADVAAELPAVVPGEHAAIAALVVDDVLAGADTYTLPAITRLERPVVNDQDDIPDPEPIPVRLVEQLPSQRCGAEAAGSTDESRYPCEVYRFLVATADGRTLTAQVPIVSTTTGPFLAENPALAPYEEVPDDVFQLPLSDLVDAVAYAPSEGGQQQLARWVNAYVRDDRTELYDLTGDTAERRYSGLTGFSRQGSLTVSDGTRLADSAWVRVSFSVIDDQSRTEVPMSFDILMTNLDARLPRIVAWGAAGRGDSLVPFENGIAATDLMDVSTGEDQEAES